MKNFVISYSRDKIQENKQILKELETKHNKYIQIQEVCTTWDLT